VIAIKNSLRLIAWLLLVPAAIVSCASNPPRVNDVQQYGQRLQGAWLLRSYRPSVGLEAPLQALLNAELGQMRITIDNAQLIAQGPGLQVVRSYRIQEVADQTATIVVSEPSGVSVRVWIEFRDNLLTFRPLDAPWSGEGSLQRL
jgi:hypothetical protein